ncbi:TPA: hypothetical protein ACIJRM_005341 [Klebsiella oxytoca]
MKVLLVGGPYDNEFADVAGDELNAPIPFLNMHPKLEPLTTALSEDIHPNKSFDILVYKLERIYTSPHKWHWEYHYEG